MSKTPELNNIKIVLNRNLEKKKIKEFTKLNNQHFNLDNKMSYFAEYEYNDNLITQHTDDYRTNNNFINAFLDAYNFHKTIKIRPDDIKLQILMIIATCINNNAEKYRHIFVDHKDKKELVLINSHFDADYFTQMFGKLLKKSIKNPEFAKHYTSSFTTTNRIIKNVNNITLMNTLKEYFSFTMILECGIPAVILDGTLKDWIHLKNTYEYFKGILIDSELKDWFRHFDKIMNLFIMMSELQNNNNNNNNNYEVEATQYIKDMFDRIITYIPQGSGNGKILGGWIRLFSPYHNNKIICGLDKELLMFDLTKKEPTNKNYYKWQDEMKDFYLGGGWGEMNTSFITTPAKLINYDSSEYKVEFYSGIFNPKLLIDNNGDEIICMNIGYVLREDQEYRNKLDKDSYILNGVKVNEVRGSLEIPRILRKETKDILKCFDTWIYNYYGVDPEEEKLKEYYLNNGVSKIKAVYSYKLSIPEKFRDKVDEIIQLFSCHRVKYY